MTEVRPQIALEMECGRKKLREIAGRGGAVPEAPASVSKGAEPIVDKIVDKIVEKVVEKVEPTTIIEAMTPETTPPIPTKGKKAPNQTPPQIP